MEFEAIRRSNRFPRVTFFDLEQKSKQPIIQCDLTKATDFPE